MLGQRPQEWSWRVPLCGNQVDATLYLREPGSIVHFGVHLSTPRVHRANPLIEGELWADENFQELRTVRMEECDVVSGLGPINFGKASP